MKTDRQDQTDKNDGYSDLRLGELLQKDRTDSTAAALLGFPSDVGVARNNGRVGAAKAPGQIRERLSRLTPYAPYIGRHSTLLRNVFDAGDLELTGDLKSDQQLLGTTVAGYLEADILPVIIGGGHETSFGHFLGYAEQKKDVSIVNIDAHTDVRPLKEGKPHSGSPFRQALGHESGSCRSYSVFGLNPTSVARDHLDFVTGHGGEAMFRKETTLNSVMSHLDSLKTDHLMITMDMDAVRQEAAPGVSAPASEGLSPELWFDLAYQFGKHPRVTSFDLCEVNPKYDIDGRTVRLAAATIWYFLQGLSFRKV